MPNEDYIYGPISDSTMSAIRRYIDQRLRPGDFLLAVLSNDLRAACARADDESRVSLFSIVMYLYNEAPSNCWGSRAIVAEWLDTTPRTGKPNF